MREWLQVGDQAFNLAQITSIVAMSRGAVKINMSNGNHAVVNMSYKNFLKKLEAHYAYYDQTRYLEEAENDPTDPNL